MFIAILLAGERSERNELLKYAHVNAKSLIEINGKPMILYVLEALLQNSFIDEVIIVGPHLIIDECQEIRELITKKKIRFYEQKKSPALSILSLFEEIDENKNILITTSDNVLLKSEWIDFFCNAVIKSEADILMAVNDFNLVKNKYPESKRTVLKFKDISLCFCNLFAIMSKKGKEVVHIWLKVETLRKKPFKIARMFMPVWGLFLFLMGVLSSKKAFSVMSKKLNANVDIVNMPYPEACIDVDKIEDLVLVRKILGK